MHESVTTLDHLSNLIYDHAMKKIEREFEHLLNTDPSFFHFISDTFNDVAGQASTEDLAEYAFGSLEEALDAYRAYIQQNS